MIYKASSLIAESFAAHSLKYRVVETDAVSIVEAAFCVAAGPQVVARFISRGDGNDVAFRIFGLMCKIPESKRGVMLEACNMLNETIRFFKFYMDGESSINIEADLPARTDDSCVGESCFELFLRAMNILDEKYPVLARAMYTDPGSSSQKHAEILRLLTELRSKPLSYNNMENETEQEERDAP